MLQFFRKAFSSKLGAIIALGFLGLIALAFASGDVANTGGFGGVAGGDRVATVGNDRVDAAELSQAATSAVERIRQQDPKMSMKAFLAAGALEQVLTDVIDRTALAVFGKQIGIVASDRLIDSEITQMPAFKGPDGNFSKDAFQQAIRQSGLSEAAVRVDLRQGLIARQVLMPAQFGAVVPAEFAKRYAALLRDRRSGAIAILPSQAFAPAKPPSDQELTAWYTANRDRFIRPERRVIRYATFGDSALKTVPAPTDAEIAARFNQNKAQYDALETRTVTQLIVPTEAAANAIVAEVNGGKSLAAAAAGKGLETAKLDKLGKDALTRQSSKSVADAAFAAPRGTLAAVARGPLGWHVMMIDAVETRPARTLAQVSGEITTQLAAEKRRTALTDMLESLETEFDDGGNLADAAKALGAEIQKTPALTADGQVYLKPGERAPAILGRVIETAFTMEGEGEPQLAEVEPGKTFVIFDVTDIQRSAAAPLADIKPGVVSAYMLDKGAADARKAADKVVADIKKGATLQQALAAVGKPLPPPQRLDMPREQFVQLQQQTGQAPPALALFFSMAAGTTKLIKDPAGRGWFLVSLEKIVPGTIADNDPMLAEARTQLGTVAGNELGESLRTAIRKEIGVKRNPAAIKAVAQQLGGGSGGN